jgi:hypothetical protein
VRPAVRAKGGPVVVLDAVLLADPQNPSGIVGDRRWLVAKDVKERGVPQRLGEGEGVPERLGTSYRCLQFIEGAIRVPEHPRNVREVELASHAGVATRQIPELHARIEELEAPPKLRQRRLEFPLVEEHHAERDVRRDETGRIAKPFGHAHCLLGKILRLFHLE